MHAEYLTGKKFGRLTAVSLAERKMNPGGSYRTMWHCVCECGKEKDVSADNLKNGKTKSCGCLNAELASQRMTVHGATKGYKRERIYDIWRGIKERCYNKNNQNYKYYGGRGIKICDEWESDYKNFKEWALNNGYQDNMSIDRIDVNGDYCPSNCRWSTIIEQNNNTRRNRKISAFNETHTLAEWAKITGISEDVISARIKRLKWDAEKALATEVRKCQSTR